MCNINSNASNENSKKSIYCVTDLPLIKDYRKNPVRFFFLKLLNRFIGKISTEGINHFNSVFALEINHKYENGFGAIF